jgi:hypothetical protein
MRKRTGKRHARRGTGSGNGGAGVRFDARAVGDVIERAVAACSPQVQAKPDELVRALVRGPSHPEGPALVDRALGRALVDAVTAAWGRGWQPADLHRLVQRTYGRAHGRLSAVALGCEAGRYADASLPVRWRRQLDAVGAEPPPDGDDRWAVPVAVDDRDPWGGGVPSIDDRADAVRVAVETLALIRGLPTLPKLGPHPGDAARRRLRGGPSGSAGSGGSGDSGRLRDSRGSGGGVDPRVLHRVTALLAKAESTTYPDEAEALTAKAQELMTRHAIDVAAVEAEGGGHSRTSGRRIGIDDPYARARVTLLSEVARANRCRAVWSRGLGFATVCGDEGDLDAVEVLYTSLLVQATRAMVVARPPGRVGGRAAPSGAATRSFRQSFLVAYAHRIGDRLRQVAKASAAEAAAGPGGGGLLPVLARRADAAEAAAAAAFPNLKTFSATGRDADGWRAGRQAADRADLGTESMVGARRGPTTPSLGRREPAGHVGGPAGQSPRAATF